MKFIIEEAKSSKDKILIIDKKPSFLVPLLKKELSKYDIDVFVSPKILPNLSQFSFCLVIDESFSTIRKLLHKDIKSKLIFIFLHKHKEAEECSLYIKRFFPDKKHQFKSINIESTSYINQEGIEKILWFALSSTDEIFLNLHTAKPIETEKSLPEPPTSLKIIKKRSFFYYLAWAIAGVILFHFLFFLPLLISNFYLYRTITVFKQKDINATNINLHYAETSLDASKKLYSLVRPTYQILSVAYMTDNMIQFDETASFALEKTVSLYSSANTFFSLLLKKDKADYDVKHLQAVYSKLSDDIDSFSQYISILDQKLPNWKKTENIKSTLQEASDALETVQKILPYFDSLMAKGTDKKYLILFANNMELRPGGGFIGSFGVLNVHNYTIDPITLYDVYDADGQLKTHVEPPKAIREFLQQPNWFLRDSAFAPDFQTNYAQAKSFLDQEMKMNNFDGGILLTTSTIENLLSAMGDLYIPDFNEKVNKDNFYIKAQLYAEKNFFPGSTQKKRFLGAVADQILINIDHASQFELLRMVQKSLEEKQLVMYFEDPQLQNVIDTQYWSGQTIVPKCPTTQPNCINDYIFPIEANLGVNKANFYTKKFISMKVYIDKDGNASSTFEVTFKNDSFNNIFPGGTYKNYFQVLLPKNAVIKTITKNDTLVENFDTTDGDTKTVGFYFEIPPQSSQRIDINYEIQTGLESGKGAYQLVLQKQIGSANSEFQLDFSAAKNIYPTTENFSPLVKNNKILYNTTLTADKIFFIELLKDQDEKPN